MILPVAELVSDDWKNLIVKALVMIEKHVADQDGSSTHLGVWVEVAATVSHHFYFVVRVTDFDAQVDNFLFDLVMLFWKWLEFLCHAATHFRVDPNLKQHNY